MWGGKRPDIYSIMDRSRPLKTDADDADAEKVEDAENEKAKEYFIETRCIDEYYVSLATEEKISIETEWFAGNGKEVK